jgi:hypothetical protein
MCHKKAPNAISNRVTTPISKTGSGFFSFGFFFGRGAGRAVFT